MKKYIYTLFLSSLLWTSCTEDNSTLAHINVPDIEIAEFNADGYSMISFQGNVLQLTADVTTTYAESQLTYAWYIVDNAKNNATSSFDVYEREWIGEGKTLNYEVNLKPGKYTIICEVKADNGYTVTQTASLVTNTDFSSGFYILKETADGNTDLDVYKQSENKLIHNVLTAVLDEPMRGKPQAISMVYDHAYMEEKETSEEDDGSINSLSAEMVAISTQDKDFRVFNTADMKQIFDRTNFFYGEIEDDEELYCIETGYFTHYLISNKGIRGQYLASWGGTTGMYGVSVGDGGSPFRTFSPGTYDVMYWNSNTHSIEKCDIQGMSCSGFDNPFYETSNLTDYECIACGTNDLNYYNHFILKNQATNEVVLYLFMFGDIMEIRPLAADSHLAQSTAFSTSNSSATYIYGVHNNAIYAYDMELGTEEQINPKGIADGEKIVYVSDQYFPYTFNYFVVGTQNGNDYSLYFYEVLGGKPDGEPVSVVNGTGKVKSIRYTESGYSTMMAVPPYMD